MADFRLRRSLLYVPGNMPSMLQNIPLFQCDAIQIDLEDAVPYSEKDAARILVRSFLKRVAEYRLRPERQRVVPELRRRASWHPAS